MNKRLYDCTTAVERLEWVKARLSAGATVSENSLVLAGIPSPIAMLAGLRASGMPIETVVGDLVDSKGVRHRGAMSWRLLVSPMGRESARSGRQHANYERECALWSDEEVAAMSSEFQRTIKARRAASERLLVRVRAAQWRAIRASATAEEC